jgi:hypothetical protein
MYNIPFFICKSFFLFHISLLPLLVASKCLKVPKREISGPGFSFKISKSLSSYLLCAKLAYSFTHMCRQCCRSGMFIPDPGSDFFHTGSRADKIPDTGSASKNFFFLTQKTKSSQIRSRMFKNKQTKSTLRICDLGRRNEDDCLTYRHVVYMPLLTTVRVAVGMRMPVSGLSLKKREDKTM